jgi:dTDP-4-dehydrorhamnose reductase
MILVTGCNPLGCRLTDAMSAELAKGACDRNCPEIPRGWLSYDAMSPESISRLVEEQHPAALVLADEIDSLTYCDQHPRDAMEFNTRAVRFFAEAAKKSGARLVYRSTAFVFDGRKPGGLYTETDKVNPINVYGETKLMGEVHADKVPDFLIVRIGELYGAYPDNFASHVRQQLKCGEKVELARDMFFSPITVDDAVSAIRTLTVNKMMGFYNVAGPERISHYDFGRRIAAAFGLSDDLLLPMSAGELGLTVRMPLDTSLDISKLSMLTKVRGIDEGLAAMTAAEGKK